MVAHHLSLWALLVAQALAWAPTDDFIHYTTVDAPQGDVRQVAPGEARSSCLADPRCIGYNSHGWLKHEIAYLEKASTDFYVRVPKGSTPSIHQLWPKPQQVTVTAAPERVAVDAHNFAFSAAPSTPSVLSSAFQRFPGIFFPHTSVKALSPSVSRVSVSLASLNESLQMDTKVSYSIALKKGDASFDIHAATVYGVLHALQTIAQLIEYDFDTQSYFVSVSDLHIVDFPRFPHRGIMIDTSRHFLPSDTLKMIIEAMSVSRLNVLHWHIIDAQTVPLVVPEYPHMYFWSEQERYSKSDIAEIVLYATLRGVRVLFEVDSPGHAWAWGGDGAYDVLPDGYKTASNCANQCPNHSCDVPVDPSKNETFTILNAILTAFNALTTEHLVHIGGDEVQQNCWSNSPSITRFMHMRNMTSYDDLYKYHVQRAIALAQSHGQRPIVWNEVWSHFTTQLPKNLIVEVWTNASILKEVVSAGYYAVLSASSEWYLSGPVSHLDKTFKDIYSVEPCDGLTDAQCAFVLGGEASMWGEFADASAVFQPLFPRAAAVAERLWSARDQTQTVDATRYNALRCYMNRRGIPASPAHHNNTVPGPGACFFQ